MTISDVATLTGLSAHAIRFYERSGVLPRVARRGAARRFSPRDLIALRWIARARRAELPLPDVQATLDREGDIREHGATLVRRIAALEARRAELAQALAEVDALCHETRAQLAQLAQLPGGMRVG